MLCTVFFWLDHCVGHIPLVSWRHGKSTASDDFPLGFPSTMVDFPWRHVTKGDLAPALGFVAFYAAFSVAFSTSSCSCYVDLRGIQGAVAKHQQPLEQPGGWPDVGA